MNPSRNKKLLVYIAFVILATIIALGLYWILIESTKDTRKGNTVRTEAELPEPDSGSSSDIIHNLELPTRAYPDDKYAKEPIRTIRTTLESMVVRSEDSPRGKVLEYLKSGSDLKYQGVRTRSKVMLDLAGKRIDGYWLKVETNEHEGWIFSPGTDYLDEPKTRTTR